MTMQCTLCREILPKTGEYFYPDPRKRNGFRSDCKNCVRRRTLRWQKINPDKANARQRRWRKTSPEKARANGKNYRTKNAEKCKSITLRWAKANPARVRATAMRFYIKNRDTINAKSRQYLAGHPEVRRTKENRRRARKFAAEGSHTPDDIANIKTQQKNKCAYCKQSLGRCGHVDHIIALSKGGTNWPNNLQWLCRPCNLSKNARDPVEFAQSRGLLI